MGAMHKERQGNAFAAAPRDERTLAEDSQALADADQALSDADQTGADSDQAAADGDSAAAGLDQEASDCDLAQGGDPSVYAHSRDLRDRGRPSTCPGRGDGCQGGRSS